MKRVLAMIMVLAAVMTASVSQGAEWVDFADYYASGDANSRPWMENGPVSWVGAETAATLKANGYIHAEMVTACIAADSYGGVWNLLTGYTVGKDYKGQVATAITTRVMTWSAHVDDLLNAATRGPSNAEARMAAYTWVVANQDAELTDPVSPVRRQKTWDRKARGDTTFRIAEEVEMLAVNEHDPTSKHNILTTMVPKVRAQMRAEGETFVGTAGRANVVARLQALLDQLNGGAASGLEATLRGYGVSCSDKPRTAMIERCTILLPKVMDGRVIPNTRQQRLFQTVLGATEYEKWRVAYNTGGSYTMP